MGREAKLFAFRPIAHAFSLNPLHGCFGPGDPAVDLERLRDPSKINELLPGANWVCGRLAEPACGIRDPITQRVEAFLGRA